MKEEHKQWLDDNGWRSATQDKMYIFRNWWKGTIKDYRKFFFKNETGMIFDPIKNTFTIIFGEDFYKCFSPKSAVEGMIYFLECMILSITREITSLTPFGESQENILDEPRR